MANPHHECLSTDDTALADAWYDALIAADARDERVSDQELEPPPPPASEDSA